MQVTQVVEDTEQFEQEGSHWLQWPGVVEKYPVWQVSQYVPEVVHVAQDTSQTSVQVPGSWLVGKSGALQTVQTAAAFPHSWQVESQGLAGPG